MQTNHQKIEKVKAWGMGELHYPGTGILKKAFDIGTISINTLNFLSIFSQNIFLFFLNKLS